MATIKTSCVVCGDVELQAPLMTLHLFENAKDRSYYSFRCITCGETVAKSASLEIQTLLLGAEKSGLEVIRITIPAEALEVHAGWTITDDDYLDFTLAMRDADASAIVAQEIQDLLKPAA